MKRRLALAMLMLLFVIACPTVTIGQAAGATKSPDHITLTWIGNPATTMTITWRTDATIATGSAEYQKGATLSTAAQCMKANPSNSMTDIQATRLFTATLSGLSSNTQYSYRVGDGKHPEDSLRIYQAAVEPLVQQKNNQAYSEAADLLARVNRVMVQLGRSDEFRIYLASVRAAHKPKRNFTKMIDETQWSS